MAEKGDKRQSMGEDEREEETADYQKGQIEKALLVDDHAIGSVPAAMRIKIGAYLANLMCKNLRFQCGQNKFMLLKPELVKSNKNVVRGTKIPKYVGHISFNKAFVE